MIKKNISEKKNLDTFPSFTKVNTPDCLHLTPKEVDIIFFDIETTGGNSKQGKIIEIAAIKFSNGKKSATFHTLINPGRPIPKITQSITGIKPSDLVDQPHFKEISQELHNFINGGILCSHGAISDFSFLRDEIFENSGIHINNFYICTHLIVSNFFHHIPSKSLSGVSTFFKLSDFKAHRAVADAEKTAEIFWKLYEVLDSEGISAIKDILKVQGDNATLSRISYGINQSFLAKLPNSPGLFYFYNENRELSYICATYSPKKSLTGLTQTKDDKEILRILAESNSFHFVRSSHFLEALIHESNSLRKNNLPIDPRRADCRSPGLMQLLLPNHIGNGLLKSAELINFPLPHMHHLLDYLKASQLYLSPSSNSSDTQQPPTSYDNDLSRPYKQTRKVYTGYMSNKLKLDRVLSQNCFEFKVRCGQLLEGFGWFVRPDEGIKNINKISELLNYLFPLSAPSLQTLFHLSTLVSILSNQICEQENFLKKRCLHFNSLVKPHILQCAFNSLRSLKTFKDSEFSKVYFQPPRKGLIVISNNNQKTLEIFVVINDCIKKIKRIPLDESHKLGSPRFFSRLFKPYEEFIKSDNLPIQFDPQTCDYIELFNFWMDHSLHEGEWVDFKNLEPLYQPETLL